MRVMSRKRATVAVRRGDQTTLRGERFEVSAAKLLRRYQAAIRSLIESTPGQKRRPVELAETLGIHVKLAWQAYKVAFADDPFADAVNIPKPGAIKRFLTASAVRGVPSDCIAALQSAQDDLDTFIRHHARSRGEFETMISALSKDGSEQVDLVQKRAVFRGQSHILGMQARTHLGCFILKPSEPQPGRVDSVFIRGLLGLRRFRLDASWIISQTRSTIHDGRKRRPIAGEPIDPNVHSEHGVNLLTHFCSRPFPRMRRVPTHLPNMTNIEIVGDGVGNASAVTCLLGDFFRASAVRFRDDHNRRHICNIRVRTPCEALVHDVLVHESLADFGEATLSVYSDHRDVDVVLESEMEARECDRISLKESVIYLGKGADIMKSSDVPRYPEIVRYAMERVGWEPDEFRVYRTRIEYPVMPSSVVVHFDLPEA